MTAHDYLEHYKRQEAEATRQMVALPEGILKQSAEDCLEWFRNMRMHWQAVVAACKP